MNRRDFLKLGGLVSTLLILQLTILGKWSSPPVEVEYRGKIYRGTSEGKIYTSDDAGRTWQLHTYFGPEYSILRMSAGPQVHALIGFSGYTFQLALSQNDRYWKTT